MLRLRKVFPADATNFGLRANPFAGEDIADFAACIAGLVEKRESLKSLGPQFSRFIERAYAQIALTLIAHDQQRRSSTAFNDQHGLLEPGIEIGEIGHVREMLAIRIND